MERAETLTSSTLKKFKTKTYKNAVDFEIYGVFIFRIQSFQGIQTPR